MVICLLINLLFITLYYCVFFTVDSTRVVLSDVDHSQSGSDYINANYVEVQSLMFSALPPSDNPI